MWIYRDERYEDTAEDRSRLANEIVGNEDFPQDMLEEFLNNNYDAFEVFTEMKENPSYFEDRVWEGLVEAVEESLCAGEDFCGAEWTAVVSGLANIYLSMADATDDEIATALERLAMRIRTEGMPPTVPESQEEDTVRVTDIVYMEE